MLFTFLVSLVACSARALRPGNPKIFATDGQKIDAVITSLCDRVGDLAKADALHADLHVKCIDAAKSLNAIAAEEGSLLESRNATAHMDDDALAHLEMIIRVINITIYASMDLSHDADQEALDHAADAIAECKADFDERNSPGQAGDIYALQKKAEEFQDELTRLTGEKDQLAAGNASKWDALESWATGAPDVPACAPEFESQTVEGLAEFFEKSLYPAQLEVQEKWFDDLNTTYQDLHSAAADANALLEDVLSSILTVNVSLRTEYCMWEMVLQTACRAMDDCHEEKVAHLQSLEVTVRANEENRKNAYISGETVIEHVRFLTARTSLPEHVNPDTSVYSLDYPEVPEKAECDETALSGEHWDPFLSCPDGHHAPR